MTASDSGMRVLCKISSLVQTPSHAGSSPSIVGRTVTEPVAMIGGVKPMTFSLADDFVRADE